MIDGKRVLAVVPARGGSKGIRLKNLREVGGVPMVARVGDVVREVAEIDRTVASTDHDLIAQTAREAGIDVPFMRPPEHSGDSVGDEPVLTHALEEVEREAGVQYDIITMLQPTSPLRKPAHVRDAIVKLVEEDLDAAWTISPSESQCHPYKQLTIASGFVENFDERANTIVTRQELEQLYHRNGCCYAMTRSCLLDQKNKKGRKTGYVVVEEMMVNVDTEWDIELANWILEREQG